MELDKRMKLKDILTKEIYEKYGDLDVMNNVTNDFFPSWCGNTFTEEGREHYKEALELEACIGGYQSINGAYICLLIDSNDKSWKRRFRLARDLFSEMCGYCTEAEYERWFKDDFDDDEEFNFGFVTDSEKMRDFFFLSKEEFFERHSSVTARQYQETLEYVRYIQSERRM